MLVFFELRCGLERFYRRIVVAIKKFAHTIIVVCRIIILTVHVFYRTKTSFCLSKFFVHKIAIRLTKLDFQTLRSTQTAVVYHVVKLVCFVVLLGIVVIVTHVHQRLTSRRVWRILADIIQNQGFAFGFAHLHRAFCVVQLRNSAKRRKFVFATVIDKGKCLLKFSLRLSIQTLFVEFHTMFIRQLRVGINGSSLCVSR